jgi:hypothetical protein
LGGQTGTGIALVFTGAVAFAAKLVANAPVTARAITRLRTKTFIF